MLVPCRTSAVALDSPGTPPARLERATYGLEVKGRIAHRSPSLTTDAHSTRDSAESLTVAYRRSPRISVPHGSTMAAQE